MFPILPPIGFYRAKAQPSFATANLVCHLDASFQGNVVFPGASGDGQKISQWTDLSGNGNHFTQSFGSFQPDWIANAQNGLGAIDFVRTSSEFLNNGSPFISGSSPGHMFMAFKSTDLSGDTSGWMNFGTDALEDLFTWSIGDQIYTDWGGTARHQVLSAPQNRSAHLTEIKSEVNDWDFIQNGSLVVNKTSHTLGWHATNFYLGRSDTLYGSFEMYEILIYDAAVTGQGLTDTRAYLSNRWNLGF